MNENSILLSYCIIRPGGLGLGAPTGVINVIDGQAGSIMRFDNPFKSLCICHHSSAYEHTYLSILFPCFFTTYFLLILYEYFEELMSPLFVLELLPMSLSHI